MTAQLDIKPPARYVGLDVDEQSIKLVELEDSPAGLRLLKFAIEPLPTQKEPNAPNPAANVTGAIKKLFASLGIDGREVYAAISGISVSVRRLRLPEMPENEIRSAIKWEAKNYLPFPIETIQIDFSVLGKVKEQNVNKLDILAVAVPREEMNKQVSLIENAGLKVIGLTIAPFAIWDLLKANMKLPEDEILAIIDIGSETASLNLFKNNTLQFTREISVAGESFTKCLTGTVVADNFQLNLNHSQAEAIKIKYGIPLEEDDQQKTEEGIPLSQIRAALRPILRRLTSEIQRSFDYYKEQFLEDKIGHVYLSGGASRMKNLGRFLSDSFEMPIEVINPFQNIKLSPEILSRTHDLEEAAPHLMLALGLAAGRAKELNLIKETKKRKEKNTPSPKAKIPPFNFGKINLKTFAPNLKPEQLLAQLKNFNLSGVSLGIIIALLLLLAFGYNAHLSRQLDKYKKEIASKKLVLADLKTLMARRAVITRITAEETKIRETLGKLASVMPTGVALTSLNYENKSRTALITGTLPNVKKAGEVLKTIESSPYFSNVTLKEVKRISDAASGNRSVTFALTFHVD